MRGQRIPAKQIQRAKPQELRWLVWPMMALCGMIFVYVGLGISNELDERYWNRQNIKLGQSIDCQTRPPPAALSCNPRVDGIDCEEGSRNWLREWHQPIDYACAQYGPDPVFVFSTYRDLQLDAATVEIMSEALSHLPEQQGQQIANLTD